MQQQLAEKEQRCPVSVALWMTSIADVDAPDMAQTRLKKDKYKDAVRAPAVHDLQLLLGAEPRLADGFKALSRRARSDEMRTFCKDGVNYTLRRVDRIKKALKKLDAPLMSRPSSGLDGLIKDAKRAAARNKSPETDVAILATIERISHFGLAIYTTIDRHLRLAGIPEARRILVPSTKEKREAIREMSRMARKRMLPRLQKQSK
jgi:ferritin-like metal-binding protein YciE